MSERIFPRNLTARAAVQIAGNPVTTRLESGVGNCFPGLEFDHRNLDRRFFPGLIINFGVMPPVLADVDARDPALTATTPDGVAQLSTAVIAAMTDLQSGSWQLTSITQGARTLDLSTAPNIEDPAQLWRLVRDLRHDQVTITLTQVPPPTASPPPQAPQPSAPQPVTKSLTHYRRRFIDADTGVISAAYLPGELTQSLCSPWMHDFRDCACDYWASNHPDIALGEDSFPLTSDLGAADPTAATRPLDWLRADRRSRVAASASARINDAFRLRHYQINTEWRSLAFVLEGREISDLYAPGAELRAEPLASPEALADELTQLCGLEQVVMLECLYAYYSLRQPAAVAAVHADDLTFVRHELLAVAVSEMRHLRWANQLLWTLAQRGMIAPRPPVLNPSLTVPTANSERPRALRPLTLDVLDDFIAVERPSGRLDGEYARVVATLIKGYPETMLQLARQIVAEGMEHFTRFSEISKVLRRWSLTPGATTPWQLRPITKATAAQGAAALNAYHDILTHLAAAYLRGDIEDAANIIEARTAMMRLNTEAEKLAVDGLGVPFF
ncbi:ferritin-like domain-containing protein [Bradyrhizobium sp. RT4b]|uniref:ferritin-like domain-containing protein n=1 Tax=Bradyrhizobium sp. RT4b TaxID=3156379 RepID=UPI00339959F6